MNYIEVSVNVPVAVMYNGKRWWWDKLPEDAQVEAQYLPRFDVNRQRIVKRKV